MKKFVARKNTETRSLERKGGAGFTLIELMLVIGLWAMVGIIVLYFARDLTNTGKFIERKLQNQSDLELVFFKLVIDVRSVAPSALGAYPLVSAATSSLIFFSDTDNDGITEQVRYFFGTSTIERGITVATGTPLQYATSTEIITTVIHNVLATSTPFFQYFDAQYTGTEAPLAQPVNTTDVRSVLVTVLADINPGAAPTPTFYSRLITMRNLRSN